MALTPQNQTNLANYIPTVWSKEVQAAVEDALVCGALCDRRYEKYATGGGGTIVVPVLSNLSASAFNAAADISLTTTTETAVNIAINQRYYTAYGVDDFTVVQDALSYLEQGKDKAIFAIAEQIDTSVATLFSGFDSSTGTEGTAIDETNIIAAYEILNEATAPFSERAWIFDPESITDLLGRDFFVRMDYVPDSVVKSGFQGRQILGAPVYMTNNLPAVNTTYHAAAYMHKEAIALVMQMKPKITLERFPARQSDAVVCKALWGVKEMRGTFGAWIKTRS